MAFSPVRNVISRPGVTSVAGVTTGAYAGAAVFVCADEDAVVFFEVWLCAFEVPVPVFFCVVPEVFEEEAALPEEAVLPDVPLFAEEEDAALPDVSLFAEEAAFPEVLFVPVEDEPEEAVPFAEDVVPEETVSPAACVSLACRGSAVGPASIIAAVSAVSFMKNFFIPPFL